MRPANSVPGAFSVRRLFCSPLQESSENSLRHDIPVSHIIAVHMVTSSTPETLPAISALVVIPDTYTTVARTIGALEKQTQISQLEIVFIVPPRASSSIPLDRLKNFHSIQVREMSDIQHAAAFAEGIRCARAPVVALTEDHAFPAPNWAERLLAAHQGPYVAVGPAMRNGNPNSLISLADFYIGYSKWSEPIESGPQDYLMGHNASYKRDVLLELGPRLEDGMSAETVLQMDLGKRGYQFWLEATTCTTHLNYEQWGAWRAATIYNGRVFASCRAEVWPLGKRLLYTLGSPLIPFVRFWRIRRDLRRVNYPPANRWRLYAMIGVGLALDGVGQCVGYALGHGTTRRQGMRFEFHRERHLNLPLGPTLE